MAAVQRLSILLVDDEPAIVDLFRLWLTGMPYDVFSVNSGAEALALMAGHPCNILIADVMMPGISGLDLLRRVKARYPGTQLIIVTGHGNVDMAVDALKLGAVDFLQKPVEKDKFRATIKCAAEKYSEDRRHAEAGEDDFAGLVKIIRPGRIIGKYQLDHIIGFGSQGAVYLAHNVSGEERKYAIKIQQLMGNSSETQKIMARFYNEVAALKKVHHPNIVRMIDSGYESHGASNIVYLVTEFFDGRPLDDFFGKSEAEFPLDAKAAIIYQTAGALQEIHRHGFTHRDIKPSNILVDRQFNIKLTDFGVCRLPDSGLTAMHKVIGTPLFLPPEYVADGEVGPKLDIYSLGMVSYMMFLNITPFTGETYNDLIYKIINEYPLEPKKIFPEFSPDLQYIIGRMLNKKPSRRYDHAAEICADLEKLSLRNHSAMGFFQALKTRLAGGKVWK
ncbi:MAG: protein kinase [Victivallales bacterium]|nr:protein kinase [Victivallales bacterium]